jgi:hypothetical protein
MNASFRALALLTVSLAASAASAQTLTFGSRTLKVPAPAPGFEPTSQALPAYVQASQAYLPAGTRLVEVYVPQKDIDDMKAGVGGLIPRYFQVQVMTAMDGRPISTQEFADGVDDIEAGIEAAVPKIEDEAARLTEQGNAAVSAQAGEDPNLKLGGVQYHGIVRREPWGLFFTMSMDVQLQIEGETSPGRAYSASGIILVDHQLMQIAAYADADDPNAKQWAEKAVSDWADAIRAANPDDPAVEAKAEPLPGGGGFDFGRIGKMALLGALIGLVVFLVRRARGG